MLSARIGGRTKPSGRRAVFKAPARSPTKPMIPRFGLTVRHTQEHASSRMKASRDPEEPRSDLTDPLLFIHNRPLAGRCWSFDICTGSTVQMQVHCELHSHLFLLDLHTITEWDGIDPP